MCVEYSSSIRNYVLSVSLQIKYNFYHQNTLLDAFRTNSRNTIGRNPSIAIPLLANQDLMPMLAQYGAKKEQNWENMEKLVTGNNLKIGHLKILQAPFE